MWEVVTIASLFNFVINVVLGVGIALSIIFLMYGAVLYITSTGDASQAGTAQAQITHAMIGLTVVIMALTIKSFVLNTLESSCQNGENCNSEVILGQGFESLLSWALIPFSIIMVLTSIGFIIWAINSSLKKEAMIKQILETNQQLLEKINSDSNNSLNKNDSIKS